eukprot:CAMPEP_0176500118 /NCGR_PEP_ID=MMETSP0200_2-20121128/13342_1 /TAXON_ID=947934 /ORGANISM="Chaetoceros sp., Strain GSL56" /LENGTH=407 /DNA_ID=CAMNT_0017898687 /DNA_START=45 /DNA_END=1269 /DNA_ORIENTATION=+
MVDKPKSSHISAKNDTGPSSSSSSSSSGKHRVTRKYASKCVVEQGVRKYLVEQIIKEQTRARRSDPGGRVPNHFVSNLVERYKVVIPSLTAKSLSSSVIDEKRKKERRKRKECIDLNGNDFMTPLFKKQMVERKVYVVAVDMLNSDIAISNSPPEVVLQKAYFPGNGSYYTINDDDSCVSSLSSRSMWHPFDSFTPSIKAVTPTTEVTTTAEVTPTAAEVELELSRNQDDDDDLLYAKRNAKYDLTMKVIELKRQDPNCVLTETDFSKIATDVALKHKLPALTSFDIEDIYTTIKDNDEFTSIQEKEIMIAYRYPVSNPLRGQSEEYKKMYQTKKAHAANEITKRIHERMQERTDRDKKKHVSLVEFREIVHHVRKAHNLPDDMVFDKTYFNRRIKKNELYIDPNAP